VLVLGRASGHRHVDPRVAGMPGVLAGAGSADPEVEAEVLAARDCQWALASSEAVAVEAYFGDSTASRESTSSRDSPRSCRSARLTASGLSTGVRPVHMAMVGTD
jgi:hypothetical protein